MKRKTPQVLSGWRVSSSPHVRARHTTQSIMLDVTLALLPAGIAGTVFFGFRAALIVLLSVASAVCSEALIQHFLKRPVTIRDLSAVVTGMLLAYNLPVSVPLWMPVIGSAIAIVVVKQFFGGVGQNFMNPALAGRAILLASWTGLMSGSAFTMPFAPDAISSATPLVAPTPTMYSLQALFLGGIPGCIGETSKLALLLGAGYLLWRRTISWRIPCTMLATVFVLSWVFSGNLSGTVDSAVYQLLSGGLMLGAFFMATDYASSPATPVGKLVMGVGCGLLTFVIRRFNASYPEGCSFAILLMNMAVPLIDRVTKPRVYGHKEVRRDA